MYLHKTICFQHNKEDYEAFTLQLPDNSFYYINLAHHDLPNNQGKLYNSRQVLLPPKEEAPVLLFHSADTP